MSNRKRTYRADLQAPLNNPFMVLSSGSVVDAGPTKESVITAYNKARGSLVSLVRCIEGRMVTLASKRQ